MKKCFTWLVTREMQIKIIASQLLKIENIYSYLNKFFKGKNTSSSEDVEKLYTAGGNVYQCSHCREQFGSFSRRQTKSPYDWKFHF